MKQKKMLIVLFYHLICMVDTGHVIGSASDYVMVETGFCRCLEVYLSLLPELKTQRLAWKKPPPWVVFLRESASVAAG